MTLSDEMLEWKKRAEKRQLEAKREEMVAIWTARFKSVAGSRSLAWRQVYDEYIKSPLWKMIRQEALDAADGKCSNCGCKKPVMDVHHKNYDNIGGHEVIGVDIFVFCKWCHDHADKTRAARSAEAADDNLFSCRVAGYAEKRYGEDWMKHYDLEDIEEEFFLKRFKDSCRDNGETFYSGIVDSMEYLEFCAMVRSNQDNDF